MKNYLYRWKKGPRHQSKNLTILSRNLRQSMTDAERRLWMLLRNRNLIGLKFRRQVPYNSYILDFYCPERKICIEVDGSQHYSEESKAIDRKRDEYLAGHRIKVLRYSDRDVLINTQAVLEDILQKVRE